MIEVIEVINVEEQIQVIKPSYSDKIGAQVQVNVYPNPFTNNLFITLPNETRKVNFELFDISGKK